VRSLTDTRVRYVRSDKVLAVYDSWEFARKRARGRYIYLMGDDDAMTPCQLSYLSRIITEYPGWRIFGWYGMVYDARPMPDGEIANHLKIGSFTGKVSPIASSKILEAWFALRLDEAPAFLGSNMCYRMDLVKEIENRAGGFYLRPCPDVTSSTMGLATEKQLISISYPLSLVGRTKERSVNVFAANHEKVKKEWVPEAHCLVPLSGLYPGNGWAESLLVAKKALPDELRDYELDMVRYFVRYYRQMMSYRKRNPDISYDLEQYRTVLQEYPYSFRFVVAKQTILHELLLAQAQEMLRKAIRDLRLHIPSQLWALLKRVASPVTSAMEKPKYVVVLDGEAGGFEDILTCSRRLEAILKSVRDNPNTLPLVLLKEKQQADCRDPGNVPGAHSETDHVLRELCE